jgi:excisionase family DNA binding protein
MVARKQGRREERMTGVHPEVLDVAGAARVLGVSRWLVLRLARQGKLPGKKVGKEWRFRLSTVLRWLGDSGRPEPGDDLFERMLKDPRVKVVPRSRV